MPNPADRDGAAGAAVTRPPIALADADSTGPTTAEEPCAGRFVIHLPVTTADLATAANLACALARSVAFLPVVDAGETTVSEEDDQRTRHRVFCDARLAGRLRCARRAGHAGACAPAGSTR